ncbi:hypothetical protein [Nitrospira japonica]|uniref:hypothetical protein n=1 Tax=Nitrospira japonica TaxID=1325564 RepID=UPI0012DC1C02|nr:hypothetical protein [Nitrospira japonica]
MGWVYGGIGVVIICGIITAAVLLNLHRKETDPVTGCPKDGYESITSVLVDLTDPINPVQEAALQNALLKVRDEVPKYGRLEIYPLKPTITTAIEPLFFGCSPGSGRDEDNGFYGNPELANRRWKRMFADKVDAVINELQKLPPQQNSPLLEGLQSVAVTSLGSPLAANASTKRILLLSDMIHHTPELSMYKGAPDFVQFKSTQYYPRIKPTLRGAQVDVFLIVRDTQKHVQQPPLYKFWVEFMNASGGFLQNWEPLQ